MLVENFQIYPQNAPEFKVPVEVCAIALAIPNQ